MSKDALALSKSETKNWIKTLNGPAIMKLSVFNQATLDRYEEDIPHMHSLIQEVKVKIEELNKLAKEITEIDMSVGTCGFFNVPFEVAGETGMSIFTYTSDCRTWETYKQDLYKYWKGGHEKRTLLPCGLSDIIYSVFRVSIPLLCIILAVVFKSDWLRIGILSSLGAEIFADAVSWQYFMVRPNIINSSIFKKQRADLYNKGRLLFISIQSLNNRLEAEELLCMNPKEKLALVKESKRSQLESKLREARQRAESINPMYKDSFISMLDKCDRILKMALVNGQVITSVQRIYEVYLGGILNILESGDNHSGDVELMLTSFNSLLDKQLERFSSDTKRAVAIDVSAITASIKSDISDMSTINDFGEEIS